MPLKLPQKFKYKLFLNASIPLSTNSDVAPLNSSPLVFFEFNKGKAHVVVDGDPITFASGDSTHLTLALLGLILSTSLLMREVKK